MVQHLGLFFAFLALLFWGVGDLMIQKSVRQNSVLPTLYYICLSGGIALFPFILGDLEKLNNQFSMHFILIITSLIILLSAILEFIAMKLGKISIIEPILSFELPVAVMLSVILHREILTGLQLILILGAFIGILISSQSNKKILSQKSIKFEDGIFWAFGGALLMGVVNFMIGLDSQETSALLTIWYTNMIIVVLLTIHFFLTRQWPVILRDFKKNTAPILLTCLLDNAAWIFYALATTRLPISIATTISESYIALTVILGVTINREKVYFHQTTGIILTVFSVIMLGISV